LLAGGPSFDSEVLLAYELGYRLQPAADWSASIATFYNHYDKLRSLELTPSPATLANALNGRTYGVEIESAWQAAARCRLMAGYTFLGIDLDLDPGSTDVGSIAQEGDSPRHEAFVRTALSLPHDVSADLNFRWVGDLPNQKVPDYATADVRLGCQLAPQVELAVVGRNLFEPRHAEFGLPAARTVVPRSVFGKVTCRF
jgi:iron complex outermembrane receptor protein